jgi:hypothetical protein
MTVIDVVHSLSAQLAQTADHYAASDPDSPAWEAEVEAGRILAVIAALTRASQAAGSNDDVPETTER